MNKKLKLTIKYFLINKAKELFPFVLFVIAIFTPMLIAENFFGYDFDSPDNCRFYSPCLPYLSRIVFVVVTSLVVLVLFVVIDNLWNWIKVNWWLAEIDAKNYLRKKRKQNKRRKHK